MKNISKSLANGVNVGSIAPQGEQIKNNELIINLAEITESNREKIIEEIIKNLNGLK